MVQKTYNLRLDNVARLKRLVDLDLILLCSPHILHTDDALPFGRQYRLADLLDRHNGLLGHEPQHPRQHNMPYVRENLPPAPGLPCHTNGRELAIGPHSRGDLVQAFRGAGSLRRLGN